MGKKRLQQPVIDPSLSIKAVTKGSVWAISEKDVIRMWKEATRDAEVKKKPIIHVTDLTYENIRYISTTELLEVLNRNFGGGWESLSRSVQNIILSNFDVSTVILPKDRLHKKGGFYEKKVKDGFEVLELEKGGWVEAIFAKQKSELEDDDIPSSDSIEA